MQCILNSSIPFLTATAWPTIDLRKTFRQSWQWLLNPLIQFGCFFKCCVCFPLLICVENLRTFENCVVLLCASCCSFVFICFRGHCCFYWLFACFRCCLLLCYLLSRLLTSGQLVCFKLRCCCCCSWTASKSNFRCVRWPVPQAF